MSNAVAIVITSASFVIAMPAVAQLVHGSLSGRPDAANAFSVFTTEHSMRPFMGTSPVPIFNPIIPTQNPGYMLSPGGNFPIGIGGPFTFRSTPTPNAGEPLFVAANNTFNWTTGPAPAFGFGSGQTTASPRATRGVALRAWNVADSSIIGGQGAHNLFGTTVQYVNAGPTRVMTLGHGVAQSFTLGAPGDFSAAGVNTLFRVGTGLGAAFVPTATLPVAPLFMGSDGAGGLPDVVAPGQGPGLTLLAPNFGTWIQWNTITTLVPAGATIEMISGLSSFLDPASTTMIDFPLADAGSLGDMVFLGASNAELIVPAPGALAALVLAVPFMASRRRRA